MITTTTTSAVKPTTVKIESPSLKMKRRRRKESKSRSSAKVNKRSTGKRRFHRKSRKGCATCKRRRVKCDETKPICKNCQRMGLKCMYLYPYSSLEEKERAMAAKKVEEESEKRHSSLEKEPQHQQPQQQQQQQQEQTLQQDPLLYPTQLQNIGIASSRQSQYSQASLVNSIQSQPLIPSSSQNSLQSTIARLSQAAQSPGSPSSLPMANSSSAMSMQRASSYGLSALLNQPLPNFNTRMQGSPMTKLPSLTVHPETPPAFFPKPTPTPQQLAEQKQRQRKSVVEGFDVGSTEDASIAIKANALRKGPSLSPDLINSPPPPLTQSSTELNLLDLRLMYHYTTKVWPTITAAGISDSKIWSDDIPMLAFKYPFLMHSLLAFSATHLSRTERGLDQCVTGHRSEALRLLREAVLEMSPENTDALVASALILIMDSLANASSPTSTSLKSLPPSAWIFHVKGAATILTAVWPLSEKSRFYKFISVDLGDIGDIGYDMISGELSNTSDNGDTTTGNTTGTHRSRIRYSNIKCFDNEIADLFPVPVRSPYFPTLAYMAKLYKQRYKSDFILRVFAFPALLDKKFLSLLVSCDITSMRIMRCYYKLLRNYTEEMKDKVWFLEGVSSVLPKDVDQYSGGGGMHMMLDFLGGPSIVDDDGDGENDVDRKAQQSGLLDTNNLPSSSIGESLKLDESAALSDETTTETTFMNIDDS